MTFISYKQYINEKFTDESDPIHDLGIGQRHLIEKWLNENTLVKTYLINFTITKGGKINAKEADISYDYLHILPSYIRFGKISENFSCNFYNKEELKQLPDYVGGKLTIFIHKPLYFTIKDIKQICKVKYNNIFVYESSTATTTDFKLIIIK